MQFKVGDKVVVVKTDGVGELYNIGNIGEVVKVEEEDLPYPITVKMDNVSYNLLFEVDELGHME